MTNMADEISNGHVHHSIVSDTVPTAYEVKRAVQAAEKAAARSDGGDHHVHVSTTPRADSPAPGSSEVHERRHAVHETHQQHAAGFPSDTCWLCAQWRPVRRGWLSDVNCCQVGLTCNAPTPLHSLPFDGEWACLGLQLHT